MNSKGMIGAVALSLAACGGSVGGDEPPLAGARMGGPFALVGENGRPFSDKDLKGRYRIMYFGFASCPDICPTDLQVIGQGLKRFETSDPKRGAKVTPVFVSVDGARDTPDILRTYTDAFHPRLIGATGSKAALDAATKAYGVAYTVQPGKTPDETVVNHSNVSVLYGPGGEPLAILPVDQGADAVAAELGRWVA